MASNRFRYPPAPGHGGDTFSDNLVGNQITDGSSQMTMGNFSIGQEYTRSVSTPQKLEGFSNPITLESLDFNDLKTAQAFVKNNYQVYINTDTNNIAELVLYGSLKKRLSVATQSIINFFPAALFIDGVNSLNQSGNTTAYNINYNSGTDQTTFNVSVDHISNPFVIEFTSNGELLNTPISKEQILNNLEMFGYGADTLIKVADGTVSKLRNLTTEYKNYVLTLGGEINALEYKIIDFKPQTVTTGFLTFTVEGNPFINNSSTTDTFFIKPNSLESDEAFKNFDYVERFLMNRDVVPEYTATFKLIKESSAGGTFYSNTMITWPKQDAINIDITSSGYTNYLTQLSDLGNELDVQKTNLVSRFLTAPVLKEFDTTDQKIEKTLQIYGRSFDDIKTFVDGIAYMTNVTYDSKNNIPNELIKNFARTLGWSTPNTLNNNTFLDNVLGVTVPEYSGSSASMTPAELDIELYRRILLNTGYLFKSKGTRKSIEFLLGLIGAPEALVEFNEYIVLADAKINLNKFYDAWAVVSGGTYVTKTIKYSIPFSSFTYVTGTTTNNFNFGDYPIDGAGYPKVPPTNNNFFFQRGAGWFERTEEHKSDLVINQEASTLSGCNPSVVTKFNNFTWGGFWSTGIHSNNPKAPYLDRFRRFPHMYFGYSLERIIDDKKSWVEIGEDIYRPDLDPDMGIFQLNNTQQNFKNSVYREKCGQLQRRKEKLIAKFEELTAAGTNPNWRKLLISRIRYVEMFQKNKCKTEDETRRYSFNDRYWRSAYYQTSNEKLILNVKNVDLNLNIGQGLTYDVWKQSSLYNCMFSGGTLPPPYPSSGGTWDSTNPQINAKKLDFKLFKDNFWKYFIDVKNRMTINDGKTGGYPVLQQMYLDYLNKSCGENNKYTYTKMVDYAQSMGDYWIRIVEQMVPATTLWTSGVKIENSDFHRDKFVYRCFSMSGISYDSGYTTTFTVNPTGYTSFPAPQFQARMMSFNAPPVAPQPNTRYYNNILTGNTTNPISTYASEYDINQKSLISGSELVVKEGKILANEFNTNKRKFESEPIFTKQGSTNNLLCVYGLKEFGNQGLGWLKTYNLNSGGGLTSPTQQATTTTPPSRGGTSGINTTSSAGSSGGGGYSPSAGAGGSSGGGGGGY
tara:strand:- start:3511 stop:6915 length:3405 start_codon:yes stop_codon:yes gene_type:complete